MKMLVKSKSIIPNGGLMVIYQGTIRKKSPKKQIQVNEVPFADLDLRRIPGTF